MIINNILIDKTSLFEAKVVEAFNTLLSDSAENSSAKNLVKSSSMLKQFCQMAITVDSREEYIQKFTSAIKEIKQTFYWIKILSKDEKLPDATSKELLLLCNEIYSILYSVIEDFIPIKKFHSEFPICNN